MERSQLIESLADEIERMPRLTPLRVGIDGIDAAGKTTLADELAVSLQSCGCQVIRASVDGFHRPRAERYARGELSPEGYYYDSFNYPLLRKTLLDPLGPAGSRAYRAAAFDVRANQAIDLPLQTAGRNAILLMDGIFLFRPELYSCWDLKIFVDISFEESLRRALIRDLPILGSREVIEERYRKRYIPGQQLYFSLCNPRSVADWVVYNEDIEFPLLVSL